MDGTVISLRNVGAGIREAPLQTAVAAVYANKSLEIFGTPGSGRTTFLDRLAARFAEDGLHVHRVSGVASLQQHPLGALQVAGLITASPQRSSPSVLASATAELAELVTRRSVILVDDWDNLDEATWGVLVSLQARFTVPLVVARLTSRYATQTPTGVRAAGMTMPQAIEMRPLDFEEVRHFLEEALGGQVSPDLASDVFVQTGGHVGMIVTLLDAAVREQRIQCQDDTWVQVRRLYSPSVRWWFESTLGGLSDEGRDALEVLALSKRVDLPVLCGLFSWETLEDLERRQHVRLIGSGDPSMVVHPPALVEFLAESVSDTKRARIRELVKGRHGIDFGASDVQRAQTFADQAPVLAGVMAAHLQSERADAQARWRAEPTVARAITYLRTLMRDRATRAQFDEVVENTRAGAERGMLRLAYLIVQADWHAFREGDLAAAIGLLEPEAADDSATGMFARAKIVQLSVMLGVIPDDLDTTLRTHESYPDEVNGAVSASLALACLAAGRLRLAEQHFARIPDVEIAHLGIDVDLLRGLIQLQGGHIKEAVRYASESYKAAAERLAPEPLRAFSWMYTRTLIYTRDLGDIAGVLTLMSGVPETPSRNAYQLGMLNNAVVLALTRDRPDLARKYISEMDGLPVPDGPFPGQQRDLARARLQLHEGKVEEGAKTLRTLAEDLWARGLRIASVHAFLLAHEVIFQPEHYEADLERFAQVEGRLTGLRVDYFAALATDDVSGLSEVAYEMVDNGLLVWALQSLQRAAELLKVKDEGSRSSQIQARIASLQAQLPAGLAVSTRNRLLRVRLTAREMEFAAHVATGATNKEIAERMMLSRRSVESAIARIARKLNARGRGGITDWVNAQLPSSRPDAASRAHR